jgi:uncharacterized protein
MGAATRAARRVSTTYFYYAGYPPATDSATAEVHHRPAVRDTDRAMSETNVELLRRANEAFNRGDLDGFLEYCAEDLEVEDLNNAPDVPRVTHGKQEARAVFMAWTDAFDDFRGDIEEYIDVDDRHVACVVHYRGTQRETGLEVNFRGVDVWEIRDGELVRGTLAYPDRGSAIEAARR